MTVPTSGLVPRYSDTAADGTSHLRLLATGSPDIDEVKGPVPSPRQPDACKTRTIQLHGERDSLPVSAVALDRAR